MKSKNKKVVIIGPFPDPLTGLNISNLTVYNILKKNNFLVNRIDMEINRRLDDSIGKWRWYKLKILYIYIEAYKIITANIVYCTVGQSFLGIIKYAPFLVIATIFRKKKVVHLHGNALIYNYQKFGSIKKFLAKITLKMFDKAIVLSDSLRPNFKPFLKNNQIFTCHNFISLVELSTFQEPSQNLNILFLSNLIPAKGIIPFLHGVEELYTAHKDIEVHIAGTVSDDCPEIKMYLSKLPFVTYHGSVTGLEKATLLEKADVFCLPTLNEHEGQPLSILESLKSKCYIISSNVPGVSDIISDKNGELIWPITSKSIKIAMEKIYLDRERLEKVKSYNLEHSKDFSLQNFEKNIIPLIVE